MGIALVMITALQGIAAAGWKSGGKIETFSAFYTQKKAGTDNQYNEVRFRPNITVFGNDLLFYGEGDLRIDALNYDRGYVDDVVDRDWNRKIFAFRIGTVTAGFDIGVSFYSGYSYSPFYRAEPLSAALLQFTPCYKEETVYAFSLAKEVYGYNIRAEAGYFDQTGEDRFIQYVAGVDREWAGILREGDAFYVLLQYSNEIKTYSSRSLSSDMIDFRRVFNDSVTGRITYA